MKKKKVVKKEYDYRRTFLVFTIVFSIIIGISTYWIYAYKHKHPYLEDNIINYKIDSYVKTKGNVVYLENIDNKVTNDFVNKQHKIINNNKIIDTDITKTIYKNILSIKISYILYGDLSNYEEILILNYNLKNKKIVNNDNLGTEFNDNSYKYITRIRENLPDIMSLYIKDNKLYYAVKLKDINKLCYQTNIDVSGKYIDKEIDKL